MLEPFPSRGLLSEVTSGNTINNPPKPYIASHSTAAPEEQTFKAGDSLNILHYVAKRRRAEAEQLRAQALQAPSSKKRQSMSGPSSTPARKQPRIASTASGLAVTPAGSATPRLDASGTEADVTYGRVIYTADGLGNKTLKELKEICRSRGYPVSGQKSDVIQRILDSQQLPYRNGALGP